MAKSNYELYEGLGFLPPELSEKEENKLTNERLKKVQKSNKLIRDFRVNMTLSQFRLANYIIAVAYAQPDIDIQFDTKRYCEICGIDYKSGFNYQQVKNDVKKLSDRSLWVESPSEPNCEVLVRLVNKSWVYTQTGKIRIRLDEDVKQYVTRLYEQYQSKGQLYTTYALLYTLPMKSLYSMRLYELLRSWADNKTPKEHHWEISQLQQLLGSDYPRYQDFRRKVIEKAISEINEYTDILVEYESIKESRSYKWINFTIRFKNKNEIISTQSKINMLLNAVLPSEASEPTPPRQQTTFEGLEDMPEPPITEEGKPKKAKKQKGNESK